MRKACLKALLAALAVIGWVAVTNQAQAQLVTRLIDYTHTWKYDRSGADLGTAWRTNTFNDSTWESGPGLLGFEDVAGRALYEANAPSGFGTLFPSPLSQTVTTYYFRTTFNFSGSTNVPGFALFATNMVDDGCAIYLNGRLAGGVRMPATFRATTTFSGPAAEGQLDVVALTNFLRSGVNTLAVEVHQSGATSSDVALGMRLVALTPQALAIINQPDSQTVAIGESVTFTVGVSGGPAFYRWQKDGANLSAFSNTLTIANVQLGAAGDYRVIVSNSVSVVTSSVARLTVVQDTVGPELVSAIINNGFGSNFVNVKFTEALNSSTTGFGARNTNNYRLVSSTNPNTRYAITNVLYSTALGALLAVGAPDWDPDGSYYLVVNNIADSRGNNINPNSVIGVSRQIFTNLTSMSDIWMFYDCADPDFCDPNSNSVYENQNFAKPEFVPDPFYWGIGSGIFVKESGTGEIQPCDGDVRGTIPGFQMDPTLFRRSFRLPANASSNGNIRVRFIVDDGMVVYLNGQPLLTNNAPYPITRASRATTSVGNASCNTNNNFNLAVTNLRPGTNWLAVAVLQNISAPESDTVFGLALDLITEEKAPAPTNRPPGTSTIVLTRNAGPNKFVLSWPATNYGYALMYSTSIAGTGSNPSKNWFTNEANWTQVSDQSNPYTNNLPPSTGPRRFYKLFREKLN